jgi:hypothetical protein
MAVDVSAAHLAPAGASIRFEPSRIYNYSLIIPNLPGGGTELIRLSVESVSGFQTNNAVIDMRYQNESRKVAGGAVVGGLRIVVRDFVDIPTGRILRDWRKQVHDPATGEIGFAYEYKRQAVLVMNDPKGGDVRQIILKGIWPSAFSMPEFTYNSTNGTVKIQMALEVDTYSLNL